MGYEDYQGNPDIKNEVLKSKMLKAYLYGSGVYGNKTDKSDIDYILVIENDDETLQYNIVGDDIDFSIYSEGFFTEGIKNHRIDFLECIFQMDGDKYAQDFTLNLNSLRISISSSSSGSYSKAKKLFKYEEFYSGKKSLFHSLRILNFGIQIAKHGKIKSYSSMNSIHSDIMNNESVEWDAYDKIYKSLFNELKREFKELAPLDKELKENGCQNS